MKKTILCLAVMMILVIFVPSCKTEEEFVWNPVGDWTLSVVMPDWFNFTETVSFAGTENGGTVTGWAQYNPSGTAGTWTKTGFTLTCNIDYLNGFFHNTVDFTGTSTEANPNFMTATGIWTEIWLWTNYYDITFTGTKTTNLQ